MSLEITVAFSNMNTDSPLVAKYRIQVNLLSAYAEH